MTVIAQDRGPDSMPVDAAVVVRIIDVNDNAPLISINTLQKNPLNGVGDHRTATDEAADMSIVTVVAEVPENLAIGAFVGHMSVSDKDTGDFGRVQCNLTGATAFGLFRRGSSQTEYQVRLVLFH